MAIYHVPGDVIGITSNYLKEEGRRETGGSVASSMYVDHETLAGGSLKAAGFDRIYILDFEGREGRIWKFLIAILFTRREQSPFVEIKYIDQNILLEI